MLYLVRHGQTDWNLNGQIQGQNDIPLNNTGRTQASDVADRLTRFNLEYIISSDLNRAAETAQIIGNKLNMRVEYDVRLREYDFGILTGMTRRGLDPHSIEAFFTNPTYFHAEPFEDAFIRVRDFMESIDYNKNILVVTHGGVINFVLCYFEDRNNFQPPAYLNKCLYAKIDNSSVLRVKNLESDISDLTILKNTRFFKLSQFYKLPKSK